MKNLYPLLFVFLYLFPARLHAQSGKYTYQGMDTAIFHPNYYLIYLTQGGKMAKDTVYVLSELVKTKDTCKGYEPLVPEKEYYFELKQMSEIKTQTIGLRLKGGGLGIVDSLNVAEGTNSAFWRWFNKLYSSVNLCGPMYKRKE